MTATAYQVSSELARNKGEFEEYKKNRDPMLNVLNFQKKLERAVH